MAAASSPGARRLSTTGGGRRISLTARAGLLMWGSAVIGGGFRAGSRAGLRGPAGLGWLMGGSRNFDFILPYII